MKKIFALILGLALVVGMFGVAYARNDDHSQTYHKYVHGTCMEQQFKHNDSHQGWEEGPCPSPTTPAPTDVTPSATTPAPTDVTPSPTDVTPTETTPAPTEITPESTPVFTVVTDEPEFVPSNCQTKQSKGWTDNFNNHCRTYNGQGNLRRLTNGGIDRSDRDRDNDEQGTGD